MRRWGELCGSVRSPQELEQDPQLWEHVSGVCCSGVSFIFASFVGPGQCPGFNLPFHNSTIAIPENALSCVRQEGRRSFQKQKKRARGARFFSGDVSKPVDAKAFVRRGNLRGRSVGNKLRNLVHRLPCIERAGRRRGVRSGLWVGRRLRIGSGLWVGRGCRIGSGLWVGRRCGVRIGGGVGRGAVCPVLPEELPLLPDWFVDESEELLSEESSDSSFHPSRLSRRPCHPSRRTSLLKSSCNRARGRG